MDECSICLSTINNLSSNNPLEWNDMESIYTTKCGHMFHFKCIHSWLISNDDCPYCRTLLIDVDYNNTKLYDIFTEYCPNKQQIIWKRVIYFSKCPTVESRQKIYRDKSHNTFREPDGHNTTTTTSSRVIRTRKSIFGRMIRYINRMLY